jgi:hypothetical protein
MGEPAKGTRWVPAITFGGEATVAQRQRNFALHQRLKDGDGTGNLRGSGLAGFVFDVPAERMRIAPNGESFSFRLDKSDECFQRLLNVIADHFDVTCDADEEVERLRARTVELETRLGTSPAVSHAPNPAALRRARNAYAVYCASSDGKNYQGLPCPTWDALPEAIRGHWYTVALSFGGGSDAAPSIDTFAHLADPAHALEVWRRYAGIE